jgi:hypothetical protein
MKKEVPKKKNYKNKYKEGVNIIDDEQFTPQVSTSSSGSSIYSC